MPVSLVNAASVLAGGAGKKSATVIVTPRVRDDGAGPAHAASTAAMVTTRAARDPTRRLRRRTEVMSRRLTRPPDRSATMRRDQAANEQERWRRTGQTRTVLRVRRHGRRRPWVLRSAAVQRARRLNEIVGIIAEHGVARVADLAASLDVSEPTIRRDLEYLEKQRLVRRTHGGARSHDAFNDLPLGLKTAQDLPEKRRIAREALTLLDGARVIGMTGGTTMTEFAHAYRDAGAGSVVTNALDVAIELLANPRIRVYLAGGEVRSSSHEIVGRPAEVLLGSYNIDVAVLGVDGIDAEAGATAYDPAGAAVNAVLSQRARRTIVLADATKLGRVALARICPPADVDVVVTDTRARPGDLERLRAAGCRVIAV